MAISGRVKTNIYRCTEYCAKCPFKDNGKAIGLKDGRMDEIKAMLLEDDSNSFNCHQTVYNLSNQMSIVDPQELKMCYGAFRFLLEHGRLNIQMRLAMVWGLDEELEGVIWSWGSSQEPRGFAQETVCSPL